MAKFQLIAGLILLGFCAAAQGLKVEVEGNVNFMGQAFTISEAGENISSSSTSETAIYVSVSSNDYWDKKKNKNKKWQVVVHKSDINWHNNLLLEIQRSGSGQNAGNNGRVNISDGNSFQEVTNTPNYFFKGKDEIVYIPIDVKLLGASLTMGAKQFETNIVLTVYDDW
ncbi:MAG TPA: hypothetical protein VKA10_12070 [Prolixibacteraceae bacterium]|nr:hypothetical protein [Prolixibacteraceae bacterium]